MVGHIYYLTPLPTTPSPVQVEKKVRFAEPEKVGQRQSENTTNLTLKLVISKQELKKVLENGIVSLDQLVSEKQKDKFKSGAEITTLDEESYGSNIWMPALKSIPELK
ncbi:Beta-Ala-His dipeptidase [Bienertia sinuspersici]